MSIRHGFFDLDVSREVNGVKIRATSKGRSFSVTGGTDEEAVERLIGELNG